MARNGKFLFGAIIGALFGLAFAPKKGSELRKELKSELEKGGHGEKTLQKNASLMGEDITETAQEVYQDPMVQKQIAHGKKEAAKLVEKAKKNIQDNGEEWVQIARDKIMEGKKVLEKEAVKAFDTLKKSSHHGKAEPAKSSTKSKSKGGKK
jgi:gas vesicle protein